MLRHLRSAHRRACDNLARHGEKCRVAFEIAACVLAARETHMTALAWVMIGWAALDILLVLTKDLSLSKQEAEELIRQGKLIQQGNVS
jgi:hypothetical protein